MDTDPKLLNNELAVNFIEQRVEFTGDGFGGIEAAGVYFPLLTAFCRHQHSHEPGRHYRYLAGFSTRNEVESSLCPRQQIEQQQYISYLLLIRHRKALLTSLLECHREIIRGIGSQTNNKTM